MAKYHGFLLACILSVWAVVLAYFFRTWLRERKILAKQ